jgi:hypothetical protein
VGAALEAGSINFGNMLSYIRAAYLCWEPKSLLTFDGSRDDCLWACYSRSWCWAGGRHGPGLRG